MNRFVISLILAAGLISGCGPQELKPGETRISGTISPAIPGYLNITAGSILDSAKIQSDGKFSLIIPLSAPGKAMIFFGNRLTDIYLEPGKEVTMGINSVIFPENIDFSGELGPVNHYLTLARKLGQQTAIPPVQLYGMEPAQFIRVSDSIRQMKVKLLNEYETKYQEIDPGFVSSTRSDIAFAWADEHIQYPGKYQLLKGTLPVVSDTYYTDCLNTLDLNASSNLSSNVFKEFIQHYLDYKQSVYLADNPATASLIFPESVARFRVIHKDFTNQDLIDYLIFTAIDDHLANFGTIRVESFLTDFKATCKNPDFVKTIEGIVANMEKVAMGKPAPDFDAYTTDGKKVKLSDYFGQLLYIGFWASWSDWSLQEIPYFEQLRKDFTGKPITFLMVSLDFEKDRNRWAAIIRKNNFGSIQLLQDPKSTVLKDAYYLTDFPRYFLIDKEGKIISVYAPRPTENIAETLTRLLGKLS